MRELEFQQRLKVMLQEELKELDPKARVYCCNDFKNITTKALERPDLILLSTKLPKELQIMGIECKIGKSLKGITEGITHQVNGRYFNKEYEIKKTGQIIKLNSMCFTTLPSIKDRHFYSKHWGEASRFFIERIINEMNYIKDNFTKVTLSRNNNIFEFYYKNRFYTLDGNYRTCEKKDYKWCEICG